ncbi:LytTR family DNA-binding domain-containing protein [Pseudohongiella sp. O18]|mgnify:FL=1|uniref:LytTR family DNA-binding domain-containing protein n=1 Tax=Pseudohongiella sp. O18 TaxID=2904248 RepID=UPI001F3EF79A|nr:LytTR family DNA-binding domain-containing protein [Pseudohongiella sp. O18]
MTLKQYLEKRRWYEVAAFVAMTTLFGLVNATSKILERVREGMSADWIPALVSELTGTLAVLPLIPLLVWFIERLNLSWSNVRWRILWHVPAAISFSLAHVALFVAMRKIFWTLAGGSYQFGPLLLGLLYEMRKGLLVYLCMVLLIVSYRFILERLQGEAGFIDAQSDPSPAFRHQFLVSMLDRSYLVKSEQIDWVQSAGNYVLLHCADRSYPMRMTLSGMVSQLDPALFLRIHRTAIVNLSRVSALKESGELQLELTNGTLVPVSKTYLPALKQQLSGQAATIHP